MTSETTLAVWRKRLMWRASHRGIKEMDILLGGYAAVALDRMDADELAVFERLLEVPDQDLLAYATGQAAIPVDIDGPLLRGMLAHRPQ